MTNEIELAIQNAWLAAQHQAANDTIHPSDEMYILVDSLRASQLRRRAEYMRSGHEAVLVLDHVLEQCGRTWGDLESMLEFACGFGRTTRFLAERLEPNRITSSDVIDGSTEWVSQTFGVRGLRSAIDPAELEIGGPYDLIWVGSLFSHLPRGRFEEFLQLLYKSLSPTGLLVFSTHGADKVEGIPKDPSGFTFTKMSESQTLDLDDYGSTFVTSEVLLEIGSACGIASLARVERHLWTIQDVWVASPAPLPDFVENAPIVRGDILRAEVTEERYGWVGGYARIPAFAGPIVSIELHLGELVFPALVTDGEFMTFETSGAPETFSHYEWYLEGPMTEVPAGTYPLCVIAVPKVGPRVAFALREIVVP